MSFRDDVAADIIDVFLCPDEFAEMHVINGKEMPASIERYGMEKAEKREADSHKAGIHKKQIVLYAPADGFGPLPAAGNLVTVDGRKYIVLSSDSENGMYRIVLEVSRG